MRLYRARDILEGWLGWGNGWTQVTRRRGDFPPVNLCCEAALKQKYSDLFGLWYVSGTNMNYFKQGWRMLWHCQILHLRLGSIRRAKGAKFSSYPRLQGTLNVHRHHLWSPCITGKVSNNKKIRVPTDYQSILSEVAIGSTRIGIKAGAR